MKQDSPVGTGSSHPLGNSETTIECTSQNYPIHGMMELGYLYNDPVGLRWKIASEFLCKGTPVGKKNSRCWHLEVRLRALTC